MKSFVKSKLFIGLTCFFFGFFIHMGLEHMNSNKKNVLNDRIQVDPNDFDHDRMLEAVRRMQNEEALDQSNSSVNDGGSGVERREDDHYVYYEISNPKNENSTLNVTVKDGMIMIMESNKNSSSNHFQFEQSSMHQFSIDQGLDEKKASIETLKDKVIVKIPRKKT